MRMMAAALLLAIPLAQTSAVGPKRGRLAGQFERADADGNGSLSRAEAEKGLPRVARDFDAIDADHNGEVSPEEVRAWMKARRAERSSRREAARSKFDQYFRAADRDGDGALSRDEARQGMPRLVSKFERIDTDHDGKITREEIQTYLQAKRAAHAPR